MPPQGAKCTKVAPLPCIYNHKVLNALKGRPDPCICHHKVLNAPGVGADACIWHKLGAYVQLQYRQRGGYRGTTASLTQTQDAEASLLSHPDQGIAFSHGR